MKKSIRNRPSSSSPAHRPASAAPPFARFAQDRRRIGLIARGMDGLEGARRGVEAAGGEALVCSCDVADYRAVDEAAAKVERSLGRSTSGSTPPCVGVLAPFMDMAAEDFERVTEVTYLGLVHGTLRRARSGCCRAIGARSCRSARALAYRGIPLQSAYCGAKHAIQGFTDSLRCELLHDESNVHVSMVQMPARQHAAVRLDQDRHADETQAGQSALPAGNPRRGDPLRGASPAQGDQARLADDRSDLGRPAGLAAARPLPGGDGLQGAAGQGIGFARPEGQPL